MPVQHGIKVHTKNVQDQSRVHIRSHFFEAGLDEGFRKGLLVENSATPPQQVETAIEEVKGWIREKSQWPRARQSHGAVERRSPSATKYVQREHGAQNGSPAAHRADARRKSKPKAKNPISMLAFAMAICAPPTFYSNGTSTNPVAMINALRTESLVHTNRGDTELGPCEPTPRSQDENVFASSGVGLAPVLGQPWHHDQSQSHRNCVSLFRCFPVWGPASACVWVHAGRSRLVCPPSPSDVRSRAHTRCSPRGRHARFRQKLPCNALRFWRPPDLRHHSLTSPQKQHVFEETSARLLSPFRRRSDRALLAKGKRR